MLIRRFRGSFGSLGLLYTRHVTVKLLPFDNKSELQLVLDMPEGTSLEETGRVLEEAARITRDIPEAVGMEIYSGTSAPFNFNGLVRHYFLLKNKAQVPGAPPLAQYEGILPFAKTARS